MSRRLLIKTCVLLAVTTHARSQYIDFFQSFSSLLQPFTTTKPRNDVTKRPDTKHRQTNKQKYEDVIFFEDDILKPKDNIRTVDPFNFFTTTTKPRRKSTKTTTSPRNNDHTTRSPLLSKPNKAIHTNQIINNNINVNHEAIRSINNNRDPYNNNVDNGIINGRRIDGYNDNGFNNYDSSGGTTNRATNNIYGYSNNRQTTQRTTTDYYNLNRRTTRRTTEFYNARQTTGFYDERTTRRPTNWGQTTRNPLLNRPGVKPAVVDENKPPITNRPVTARPVYDRPFDTGTYRPVNTRPPYETQRPRLPASRPVNTRPPFETERPISSVHRPITSGNRPAKPVTGTNRPDTGSNEEGSEPEIEIGPDEDEMSDSEKRRLLDICEQKCDEYKASRVKKVVALPLVPNTQGVAVNVSSCAPINIPLIIGGEVARIQQFPHMALVGWRLVQSDGYSWKCGGSLVSEQYILTAGHCTYHDKDYNVASGPPHAVQLGSSLYNDRSATVVQISAVIRHPKYKLRRSYYDVALIKMVRSVSFSDTISPACLGVPPPVGDPVIATGWGKTEYGGDSSLELRSVSLPIWDMSECREIWGTSLKLPNGPMADNQICAGERKGAKDTCQGDSGGPAQVQDGCAWRLVAVTSVGRSCGAPETPALYARIPRAFIASQVYTNVKPVRDGSSEYGNAATSGNNNGNGNNNWGSGNNNQYGNRGVANIRPIQNNNGRVPNNNGQYYGDNHGSGSDNQGVNNNWSSNNGNNNQNTRYNQDNVNNQNNRNTYDQSSNSYLNNGDNYRTTTVRYNQNYGQNNYNNANNYGQNGYNNEQNQSGPSTEYASDIRNYGYNDNGRANNGYHDNIRTENTYNDNGRTNNGYNDRRTDNTYNDNGSTYLVASRPWWNR